MPSPRADTVPGPGPRRRRIPENKRPGRPFALPRAPGAARRASPGAPRNNPIRHGR